MQDKLNGQKNYFLKVYISNTYEQTYFIANRSSNEAGFAVSLISINIL